MYRKLASMVLACSLSFGLGHSVWSLDTPQVEAKAQVQSKVVKNKSVKGKKVTKKPVKSKVVKNKSVKGKKVTKKPVKSKVVKNQPVKPVKSPTNSVKSPTNPVVTPKTESTTASDSNYKVADNFDKMVLLGEYKGIQVYGYGSLDYEVVKKILDSDLSKKTFTITLSKKASEEFLKNSNEKVSSKYNGIYAKGTIKISGDNLAWARLLHVIENNVYLPKASKISYIKNEDGLMTITFNQDFPISNEKFELMKEEVDKVLNKIKDNNPKDDFEKHLYISSYLASKSYGMVYYEQEQKGILDNYSRSAYSMFLDGVGVCESASKAYVALARGLGLESYLYSSTVDKHMGVIVKLDGKYFYFDPTGSLGFYKNYNDIEDIKVSDFITLYGSNAVKNNEIGMVYGDGLFVYGWLNFDLSYMSYENIDFFDKYKDSETMFDIFKP